MKNLKNVSICIHITHQYALGCREYILWICHVKPKSRKTFNVVLKFSGL